MIWFVIILGLLGGSLVEIVRQHRNRTELLNALGQRYGVQRWSREGNDEYQKRISNRIAITITGGKTRWP